MLALFFTGILILLPSGLISQTVLDETFENYTVGNLNGQGNWVVSTGTASVDNDSNYVYSGIQGSHFSASSQSLATKKTSFSGSEPGVSGIVYVDLWVKIRSMSDKYFAISGYDLYGGSSKRAFVFEFNTPSGNGGNTNIYDGSSKVTVGTYQFENWVRLSARVDYDYSVYQVVYNGGSPVTANFRENYTPTASGTRQAGIKEYHQLKINLGYDGATGSVDAAIDNIYVGTDTIPGVNFGNVVINHTLDVEQPTVGNISIDPNLPEYPDSTEITATLSLPQGYVNLGWTGDLTGTELVKTFFINQNMTIGANVGIDSLNPPSLHTVTVTQPNFGTITLDPSGGVYYKHTTVTAILDIPTGYINQGWTGDLTGTDLEQSFVVLNDMNISATVVLDTTPPNVYTVSNATELRNVCIGTNLNPGDIVEVLDGSYNSGSITVESSGTVNNPIIIRSKNIGGAILTGDTDFTFEQCEYIQLEGFDFQSSSYTAVKLEACNNIRITRNFFHLTETAGQNGKWILIGGIWNDPNAPSHHNRIDHNLFENKHENGNFITIDGQQDPVYQVSQYDLIDHNHFKNIGPRAVNEKESIRIGLSDLSLSSGHTVVEYNLFEDCDGDPEIISVKSCDDTIRYNTFRRSQGTLSLRSGNRSTVAGNYFFGEGKQGTGGIRIYGNDHQIYNNYFQDLTGSNWDAAITLTNGDYDGEHSGGLTSHWRIKRANICFNTLVNNAHNIEIGFTNNGNYGLAPRDVYLSNNLVVGSENQLINIMTSPVNMTWLSNIMYPDSNATLGITAHPSEILVVDPQLIYSDSLWRLQSSSPAVDSAKGNYNFVNIDVDGQNRDQYKDIGADEYSSSSIVNYPLTANDVGPYSGIISNVEDENHHGTPVESFSLINAYPNPFNSTIKFKIQNPVSKNSELIIYNINGETIRNGILRLSPTLYEWNAINYASGTYFVVLQNDQQYDIQKIILLK